MYNIETLYRGTEKILTPAEIQAIEKQFKEIFVAPYVHFNGQRESAKIYSRTAILEFLKENLSVLDVIAPDNLYGKSYQRVDSTETSGKFIFDLEYNGNSLDDTTVYNSIEVMTGVMKQYRNRFGATNAELAYLMQQISPFIEISESIPYRFTEVIDNVEIEKEVIVKHQPYLRCIIKADKIICPKCGAVHHENVAGCPLCGWVNYNPIVHKTHMAYGEWMTAATISYDFELTKLQAKYIRATAIRNKCNKIKGKAQKVQLPSDAGTNMPIHETLLTAMESHTDPTYGFARWSDYFCTDSIEL
jgi:rubrerythrin